MNPVDTAVLLPSVQNPALGDARENSAQCRHPAGDAFNRPLHDLRISVIDRCNLRCNYCMPKETAGKAYKFFESRDQLDFDEIARLTRIFSNCGVRKVRITGGEPLLRKGLPVLIKKISAIENIGDLALTTNGILLKKYAPALKAAGLKRLTVSLDTLDEKVFQRINGQRATVAHVLDGIREAQRAGFSPIKINAVIQRGINDHGVLDFIRHFKSPHFIVRLIEYMDAGTRNGWDPASMVPSSEIFASINKHFPLEPLGPNYKGEVATRYRYRDNEGEIGFVSPVTQPFCLTCSRARLSTTGILYTCLFAQKGRDLRKLIRSRAKDGEIMRIIKKTWAERSDRYSQERAILTPAQKQARNAGKIEMYQIGG